METVTAIGFPVLVIMATWALARPQDVLRRLPAASGNVDRSPLPMRTHLRWTGVLFVLWLSFAVAMAVFQHWLFRAASLDTRWTFSSRMTDSWPFALLIGLFGGMLASFPLQVRLLASHYGSKLVELVDRRGRDRSGLSLRQELKIMPYLTVVLAVALTILSAAAFDTFIQIGDGMVRYSGFLTPVTTELRAPDVDQLELVANRLAPNGRSTNKKFLVMRMRDGTAIDTFYFIEEPQIPLLIAALQEAAGQALPVKQRLDCR